MRPRQLLLCLALLCGSPVEATTAAPPTTVSSAQTQAQLLTPDQVTQLMEGGQLTEAEAAARVAAEAHPESARSRLLLARILAREGHLEPARRVLEEAKALPQWQEQQLGVPFESPREIEKVMLRAPAQARALLADVLLAEGNDPKAYYLLALAEAMEQRWDASHAALRTAEQLDPELAFAHPDTLASLRQALSRQTKLPPPTQLLTPEPPRPWWPWALGGLLGALGLFKAGQTFSRWDTEKKARQAQEQAATMQLLAEYRQQVNAETISTQQSYEAQQTAALKRKLERLHQMRSEFGQWKATIKKNRLGRDELTARFAQLHAAVQTDEAYAAYTAARKAAKAAKAAEKRRRKEDRRDDSGSHSREREAPSAFKSHSDSGRWSSGNSSSSSDNSGGNNW